MTSSRTDSGVYMLERGGHFSLPDIDIRWWSVDSGKIEQIRLQAVPFEVEGGTSAAVASRNWTRTSLIDALADHWLITALATIVVIGLAWIAPAAARRLVLDLRRRRATYLNSEAWFFRRLRSTARSGSASATYFSLLAWLRRFEPIGRESSIDALVSAANDPTLASQIAALQEDLFAPQGTAAGWSPRTLISNMRSARRTLRMQARRGRLESALPAQINPGGAETVRWSNRRVAR